VNTGTSTLVVRRSALEVIHDGLGARWVADDIRWPVGYGEASHAVDARATAAGAGLAEIGPFNELLLRGPGAVPAGLRLASGDGSATVGRVADANVRGEQGAAWFLGPDEVLLVVPSGGGAAAALANEVESDDVSAIEMTGSRTSLRLAGPTAPAVLAELCQADTTPAIMAPADLIQASIAGVRAFIARLDAGAHPGYTIMVARDEAEYAWDVIRRIGEVHGLVPVGPAAVAPVRPT
jgi:heterotetrameric sarcosine oxidase gamma subunit